LIYLTYLSIKHKLGLTPVFKHNGDYHGYCTTDLTDIDPGFGTIELFKKLVKECHKRGIKMIMDVVINHLCDRKTHYSKTADHYGASYKSSDVYWYNADEAGLEELRGQLAFSDDFFRPLKSKYFFNRAGPNSVDDMAGTGPGIFFLIK